MTKKQILRTALTKAITNGFPMEWTFPDKEAKDFAKFIEENYTPKQYIYNHKFAKALWGEDEVCKDCQFEVNISPTYHDPYCSNPYDFEYRWQYHLKEMVIAKDPIKYIGENL